jgi:hypothetical protein
MSRRRPCALGQNVTPTTIRTVDETFFGHREINARMTERAIAAITREFFGIDGKGLGRLHGILSRLHG